MDQLPTWTIDAGHASALPGFARALIRKKLKAVDGVSFFETDDSRFGLIGSEAIMVLLRCRFTPRLIGDAPIGARV
jgi:hypothetical protein